MSRSLLSRSGALETVLYLVDGDPGRQTYVVCIVAPQKQKPPFWGCVCRKLHPAILMVKPTEDGLSGEPAETLDWPMAWHILPQG